MRVVSLLPSATEILFAIGAGDDVVGVTFECDEPAHARTQARVVSNTSLPQGLSAAEIDRVVRARMAAGEDLYTLDEGALAELQPELVVTQDLCAVCAVDVSEVDAALDHLGCTAEVLATDPMRLDEVLASIVMIGEAVGRADAARALVASLKARLDAVAEAVAGLTRPRVTLLEWTDPPFSAGHWIPEMITAAGGAPVLGEAGARSAAVTWDAVRASHPDVLLVSPCGFRTDGAAALAAEVVEAGVLPEGVAVWAVDADAAYARPGPRLVEGVETLAAVFHPGLADRYPEASHPRILVRPAVDSATGPEADTGTNLGGAIGSAG